MAQSVQASLSRAKRLHQSNPDAGRALYADVLARFPKNKTAANGLGGDALSVGRALLAMGRAGQAAQWFRNARGLDEAAKSRHLALSLLQDGQADGAEPLLETLVAEVPGDATLWNNYGTALKMQGKGEEAAAAFTRAVSIDGAHAPAWLNLSSLRAFAQSEIAQMEARLPVATDLDQTYLHFALGTGQDKLGNIDAAFAHFAAGNAQQKVRTGYDLNRDVALFRHLAQNVPTALDVPAHTGPRPVFIVGMPRSGTTLLERMLARHPKISACGERTALAEAVQESGALNAPGDLSCLMALRNGMLSRTPECETPFYTDKMPLNFRLIGLAAAAMPEAVFLHIHRDPLATCWSNFRHFFTDTSPTNGFSWDLTDLGLFHGIYTALMTRWHEVLPNRVLDIGYEVLTLAPERVFKGVLNHIDLPNHDACLHPEGAQGTVATASSMQVRKPIYQGSSEKWQAYCAHLTPLREALGLR